MISANFVYLALALSAVGGASYVRDTLRGVTSPNRVTWSLWGVEGVLAFGVEVQQHVGLAAWMTLMLGLVPVVIVVASFRHRHGVWKIGTFDIVCGAIAVLGLVFWGVVHESTVALVSFVIADQVAALPTVRKSWVAPASESARVFFLGAVNCVLTILTLKTFTTAGVLFPGCIALTDTVMAVVIVSRVGPRRRGHSRGVERALP